jgi:hypothetical protein
LRYPEGGAFLAGFARRARKYYLGLVTVTQDVADFLGGEHGRTVLANGRPQAPAQAGQHHDRAGSRGLPPLAGGAAAPARRRQGRGPAHSSAAGGSRLLVQASPIEHRLATTAPRELGGMADLADLAELAALEGTAAPSPANGDDRARPRPFRTIAPPAPRRRLGPLPEDGSR